MLLPPNDHRFRERHPRPRWPARCPRVADTSLTYDRGRKSKLYASSGIAEYWLLDVPGRSLEIRRQPAAGGYGILRRAAAGELIAPSALPDCLLDWARVFT
jgi:Uma2 family endonuclease